MENVKYIRALEITSSAVKFAVGYVLKNVPCVLYYKQIPLSGVVKEGRIAAPDKLVEALQELHQIDDDELDLHMEPNAVSVVLPALGFKVFQTDKATNIVASDGVIAPVDVSNVMSLVNKQVVPQDNVIVDIVPEYFVANRQAYKEPPLGVKSDSITVRAKVYTLPEDLLDSYKKLVQDAGFRVLRTSVATYGASQLIKTNPGYPSNYLLMDLGADLTTISFIGNGNPYSSRFIKLGGNSLTETIAKRLRISFDTANELKETYGYDLTKHAFETPLYSGPDLNGSKVKYHQKDLNAAIEEFFGIFNNYLKVAFQQLSESKIPNFESYPVIITGGGSCLNGIGNLLAPGIGPRAIYAYIPSIIGARDPEATNLLGMIVAEGSHKKSNLVESYRGVSALSRE